MEKNSLKINYLTTTKSNKRLKKKEQDNNEISN
jgi:hypothetical protein